jgi:hypothetical protein
VSDVVAWGVREPVNGTVSVFHDEQTAETEARVTDGDLIELVERPSPDGPVAALRKAYAMSRVMRTETVSITATEARALLDMYGTPQIRARDGDSMDPALRAAFDEEHRRANG